MGRARRLVSRGSMLLALCFLSGCVSEYEARGMKFFEYSTWATLLVLGLCAAIPWTAWNIRNSWERTAGVGLVASLVLLYSVPGVLFNYVTVGPDEVRYCVGSLLMETGSVSFADCTQITVTKQTKNVLGRDQTWTYVVFQLRNGEFVDVWCERITLAAIPAIEAATKRHDIKFADRRER